MGPPGRNTFLIADGSCNTLLLVGGDPKVLVDADRRLSRLLARDEYTPDGNWLK